MSRLAQRPGFTPTPKSLVWGFTLVEMLIVTALSLIIGAGLMTTFLTGRSAYLSADAYIQVQQEARRAFDNVVRELRESGNISCGTTAPPNVCGVNNARLNFQIATDYTGGSIQWDSDVVGSACQTAGATWDHYAIIPYNPPRADGTGQLVRFCDGGATLAGPGNSSACAAPTCRVLANNVVPPPTSGFIATDTASQVPPKPNLITVNLQVRYTNPQLPNGAQTTGTLTSRVKVRNSY